MDERATLTVTDAAAFLGISPVRVRALIAAGRLPASRFGRNWVVLQSDLRLVEQRHPGRPAHRGRVDAHADTQSPGLDADKANVAGVPHVTQHARGGTVRRERIIALPNRKGGVGKSTTSLNLGGAIADRGHRVLLVDLDPQASLSRLLLAEDPVQGIGTCLRAPGIDATPLISHVGENLDLLPGDRSIEVVAIELHDTPTGFKRLGRVLSPLTGYDFVLLDTPPALGFALTSALMTAGWAVIPSGLIQQDLTALQDTIRAMQDLQADDFPCAELIAIVPNLYRGDSADRAGLEALVQGFGDLVTEPIPLSVAIKHAANARLPVSRFLPKEKVVRLYRDLAERVERRVEIRPKAIVAGVAYATR